MIDHLPGICMLVQLGICVAPLCITLPKRTDFAVRLGAGFLLVLVSYPVSTAISQPLAQVASGPALLLRFSCVLLAILAAIMLSFDVSVWQGLFCCTAAWAAQNLMSGTGSFLTLVGEAVPGLGFLQDAIWALAFPTVPIYPLYLLIFVRLIKRRALSQVSDKAMVLMALSIVAVVMGLDIALRSATIEAVGLWSLVMMRVAHGATCIFTLYCTQKVLVTRQITAERAVEQRMAAERERQYQLSRQNIDAINIKCHDIKHQIHELAAGEKVVDQRVIDDITREVNVFDSVVETGNAALDTVLTEKGLVCSREQITLAVIADGSALCFMDAADIYALFGNALDNAIEATGKIAESEQRLISLDVHRANDMVAIGVENSCKEAPRFVGGLPLSSKGESANHGFGTRSMRQIVEKYDGNLRLGWADGTFYANAYMPLPE